MSFTITLPEALERQLETEAERAGVDVSTFAARAVEEKLRGTEVGAPTLQTFSEAALIALINEGLTPDEWLTYRHLIQARQQERLSEEERLQLLALTDRLEALNVRRIEVLTELAQRRGKSLAGVMLDLGIAPAVNG